MSVNPAYPPVNPAYPPVNPAYPPPAYGAAVQHQPQQLAPPPPAASVYGQQNQAVTGQPMIMTRQVIAAPQFREQPVSTVCPLCRAQVITATSYKMGTCTWLVVGIIILVGIFFAPCVLLGCCFIPLCVSSCKDVTHTCPNCNRIIHTWSRA